jgi:hypothetical protein
MTVDQRRAARESNPFRPFTISLAGGRAHRVTHRDYLSLSPSGRTAIVYRDDDSFSILDVLLVTEVEVDAPGPQPTGTSA